MTYVEQVRDRPWWVECCWIEVAGAVYGLSVAASVASVLVELPRTVRRGQPLNGWLSATARQVHAAAVRDSRELPLALRR